MAESTRTVLVRVAAAPASAAPAVSPILVERTAEKTSPATAPTITRGTSEIMGFVKRSQAGLVKARNTQVNPQTKPRKAPVFQPRQTAPSATTMCSVVISMTP